MIPESYDDTPKERDYSFRNFQRVYGFPRCSGCKMECVILYDSHRDEYFSYTCGLVMMEQGTCHQSNEYDNVNLKQYLRYLKSFIKHNEKVIEQLNQSSDKV